MQRYCRGLLPLTAKLLPWMESVFDSTQPFDLIREYGSPVNLIATQPMLSNAAELQNVANDRDVDLKVYFARKANKCLSFVDVAIENEICLDTASEAEIEQALARGAFAENIVCTAAIKSEKLIDLCIAKDILIAIDNRDELELTAERCVTANKIASVAIRLGGFRHDGEKLFTRFGFDVDRDVDVLNALAGLRIHVLGIHFHIDGSSAEQRVSGLQQSLKWFDRLAELGHKPSFIDIGGGFPVCYLASEHEWQVFCRELNLAVANKRSPLTYRNHLLGLDVTKREPGNCYPTYQTLTRRNWLTSIFDSEFDCDMVAGHLRKRNIELRCEPGRALLDGCGMTFAKVEFRKQNAAGDWLIGLAMNRTQCRTNHDDFLVDPILVPCHEGHETSGAMEGFLVGAYCTEAELITLRKLHFPDGVQRGDVFAFINTAGYQMHFMESRSHQFPLAKNIIFNDAKFEIDDIDR